MSWFRCYCDYVIHDNSDYHSFKGHIMADQDYFDYLDSVSAIIESENAERKKLADDFYYKVPNETKMIYQCPDCGRIYINSGEKFFCFKPENHDNTDILKSVHGEKWKGFIHAEWKDDKPEWAEYKGYVSAYCNIPCESINSDDKQEIIEGYYKIFEELKSKNLIRSSWLRINNERAHEWSDENK